MDRARIRVDFNELVERDLVLLAKDDIVVDSAGYRVQLQPGLSVHLYERNDYTDGELEILIADGTVEPNNVSENGAWTAAAKWCCRIDSGGIRNLLQATAFRIEAGDAPEAGERRLGRIVVGEFAEQFVLTPPRRDMSVAELAEEWRNELEALVQGAGYAVLWTDPRFAWVLYREGDDIFVQNLMFIESEWSPPRDEHGRPTTPPARRTTTEDGEKVSEWRTTVAGVVAALGGA